MVGRMGGDLWARTREQFVLPRPSVEQRWPAGVDRLNPVDASSGPDA
jgi:hypothetical protein